MKVEVKNFKYLVTYFKSEEVQSEKYPKKKFKDNHWGTENNKIPLYMLHGRIKYNWSVICEKGLKMNST